MTGQVFVARARSVESPGNTPERGVAALQELLETPDIEAYEHPDGDHGHPGYCWWIAHVAVSRNTFRHARERLRPVLPAASDVVVASGVLLSDDSQPPSTAPTCSWLMPVSYEVPLRELADLDAWYDQEHTRMLLKCPIWTRTRRYEVSDAQGVRWNRLVLHDLATDDALSYPEVIASMNTPWRRRLAERPWFMSGGRAPVHRREPDTAGLGDC